MASGNRKPPDNSDPKGELRPDSPSDRLRRLEDKASSIFQETEDLQRDLKFLIRESLADAKSKSISDPLIQGLLPHKSPDPDTTSTSPKPYALSDTEFRSLLRRVYFGMADPDEVQQLLSDGRVVIHAYQLSLAIKRNPRRDFATSFNSGFKLWLQALHVSSHKRDLQQCAQIRLKSRDGGLPAQPRISLYQSLSIYPVIENSFLLEWEEGEVNNDNALRISADSIASTFDEFSELLSEVKDGTTTKEVSDHIRRVKKKIGHSFDAFMSGSENEGFFPLVSPHDACIVPCPPRDF